MKEDFNDRLIEESLKQYSRVLPPENFEARLAARAARPRISPMWWALIPAAATLGAVLMLRFPEPLPPEPGRVAIILPAPQVQTAPRARVRKRAVAPHPRWHVLTGAELAKLSAFPGLFEKPAEKELKDLEVPELEVKPLAGSEEPGLPKELQP
jgi:hypothetical protein